MRRRTPWSIAGSCVVALALAVSGGAGAAAPAVVVAPHVPAGDGGSSALAPLPPSGASASPAASLAAAAQRRGGRRGARNRPPRRGGRVRAAWPHRRSAQPPRARLARWLARQTGPVAVARRRRGGGVGRTRSPGNANPRASAAQASQTLLLVRSFDIPRTDPAYATLTNFSWTYDNALAVFAFLSDGERDEAEQLLDQLKALQRADGSLDFAYDVSNGAGAGRARAGAMAWVGLAAAAYKRLYGNARYDTLLGGVLDYVLGLRTSDGLVKGGTDVGWVSTQHNLLTAGLLRDVVDQIGTGTKKLGSFSGSQLNAIQTTMGNAILSKLLVQRGALASFRAGVGDDALPLDVQALGAMYLDLRGDGRDTQVANYLLQGGFYVAPRLMPDGRGPYSGYRPYADAGSPNVIWTEGTFEAALALRRLGIVNVSAQLAVTSLGLTSLNGSVGPIGADRVSESRWGEFHTWPASAAASWLLVLSSSRQMLYAQ